MLVACRQFWGPDVQKTVVFHSCSLDKVDDVPARAVRSLALGGATDSVHRLIWWTSQFAWRQGIFSKEYMR